MTPTQTVLTGTLLDRRYRVETLLARGGMSSVYRGLDTRLDRPVAIKVMDSRFADDRTFVDRFEREARSAARLHHPHVVGVHDQGFDTSAGPENSRVFLVLELVDGGTLRDLLDRAGALGVPLALTVFEQVLSALAAAHAAGLVHRDVKPENVLIGRGGDTGGVVKVGDFGLVRAVANAGTTSTSVILGTVAYLSPEQVTSGAAGARADVYSAGILLYEMLTGQVPYTADTALSVAYRHVNDDVPPPSHLVGDLPPEVDELVVRATRRDPRIRPADADAFLAEVTRIRTELGLGPVPVPVRPAPHEDPDTVVDRPVFSGATNSDTAGGGATTSGTVTRDTARTPAHSAGIAENDADRTAPAMPSVPAADGSTPGAGPRGTQALPRGPLVFGGTDSAPSDAGGSPPSKPPTGAHAEGHPGTPERPARRRGVPMLVWVLLGVLLLSAGGTGLWWFTEGRYLTVPKVIGLQQDEAEQKLTAAELDPVVTKQRHNTTPSGAVIRTDPGAGSRALSGAEVTVVVSLGKPVVPDVPAGASQEQARNAITDSQLTPRHDPEADRYSRKVPKGAVVALKPRPGSQANVGDAVTIVLSKGPPPTPVPNVAGTSKKEAFRALREAGFEPYEANTEFSGKVPAGHVIRTEPASGATVEDGNRVGVVVSNAVRVPSVVGRRAETAVELLHEAGLKTEGGDGNGPISFVIGQEPEAGSLVRPGTTIGLSVVP